MKRITVALEPNPYDVLVGSGVRSQLADEVALVAPRAKAAVIVTQASILDEGWIDSLTTGLNQEVVLIGEGEDAKSLATIQQLCSSFVGARLSRNDVVVAVGGGLVTDVAGFASATFHRGTNYVSVPSTLLAQIDASIGGKTGVNLPEGKNLVGAFYQPRAVLADVEMLNSLPPRQWACGKGEMAKYAFLTSGEPSVALLGLSLEDQVAACVAIKAEVVANDEFETGRRMILNYGHTLGHALEAVGLAQRSRRLETPTSRLAHGEAVGIGLIFAALLAKNLGRIDEGRVDLHRQVVSGFALSGDLPSGLSSADLLAAMARDKKAHHDLTFVLDGPSGVEPVSGIDPKIVLTTLLEMGANQ